MCPDGTFGQNCREECHCKENMPCTNDHGICPGLCLDGWFGPQCNTGRLCVIYLIIILNKIKLINQSKTQHLYRISKLNRTF